MNNQNIEKVSQGQDKAPRFVRIISALLVIAGVYIIFSTIAWLGWTLFWSDLPEGYSGPNKHTYFFIAIIVNNLTGFVITASVGIFVGIGAIISARGLMKMKRWGLYGLLAILSFVVLQATYISFFGAGTWIVSIASLLTPSGLFVSVIFLGVLWEFLYNLLNLAFSV